MIGSRALQLAAGAPYLVKISKKELEAMGFNPIKIAMKEFEADVLPMTVRREKPERKEAA